MKKILLILLTVVFAICLMTACNNSQNNGGEAGLYDGEGKLLASWSALTETYGLDIQKDYSSETSRSADSHLAIIMENNPELKSGKKLVIDSSVKKIGSFSLASISLAEIVIPAGVTEIGSSAMRNSDIKSINIPEGVTVIKEMTFDSCDSLETAKLPSTVKSIERFAFGMCYSLTEVNLPEGLVSISDRAFLDCLAMKSLSIPASLTEIGFAAFGNCSSCESISVASDNPSFKSIDGNLYTKDGKTLIQYAIGKTEEEFLLPDGVVTVSENAFFNSLSLKRVRLSESVTSISNFAFWSCVALESVYIPVSVENIGNQAFSDCSSLTDVCYGGTGDQWSCITIGSNNAPLTDATLHLEYTFED